MKRKWPTPSSDQAAAHFVDQADLTQYDLRGMKPVRFEFAAMTQAQQRRIRAKLGSDAQPPHQ